MLNVILKVLLIIFLSIILLTGLYFVIGSLEFKRDLNFIMHYMALDASEDLAKNLPRHRDINKVLIASDVGATDEGYRLNNMVADHVSGASKFAVYTWDDAGDRAGEDFTKQFGDTPGSVGTARQAAMWLNREKNMDIHGILFLEMIKFTDGGSGTPPAIELRANLFQVANGQLVGTPYVYKGEPGFYLKTGNNVRKIHFILRLILWLIIAGSLPFIAYASGVAKAVLSKRQNAYNLSLLASMTLVAFFAAWLLLGFAHLGAFLWIMVFILTGVAAFWNFDALNFFSTLV